MVPTDKVLSKKAEIISEIKTRVEGSAGVYLFDYRGLTVSKLSGLRTQLRESNAKATRRCCKAGYKRADRRYRQIR